MMNLYRKLKLKPIQSKPGVWVSRLMIFEDITPKNPTLIRDIRLTRGLNIVWAEEAEDEAATAEITGHSAGKTTLCRFLRYVLGENTFGKKAAMELIRQALPNGYVAAEIHVGDKNWAVRRPFGSGRMSYVLQNATIEELIEQRGRSVSQETYSQELGLEAMVGDLETIQVVQTAEPIMWAHILAWCARDQEARFQNIYDWRSPRSDADTPAFRFPKVGPLFVMRTALGLFLPDELKGEERLAELQRKKDRLTKEIEEKRHEPQWRVNLYDQQLRQRLKVIFPDVPDMDSRSFRSGDLLPEDLTRLTSRAARQVENAIGELERERMELQARIDDLGADIRQHEGELSDMDALFELDAAAGRELDQGLSQRQNQRKNYQELREKTCPVGGVPFRECSYVVDRQRSLQRVELQDTHAMEQAEAKRTEERGRIEEEKKRLRDAIERLKGERQSAFTRRDALQAHVREKRDDLHDLQHAHDELAAWTKRHDAPGEHEDVYSLRQKLEATEGEIARIEKELTDLLRQHDENRKRLAAIFSGAVRSVLSSDGYDGEVALENRELAFRITHGPAMSGEAVETLSVLLCDLASVVYNTVSDRAHLPGFLVHDSPREADLGLHIYRSFIRFAASLQEAYPNPDQCPFQYILTTTTPPPDDVRGEKYVRLTLNAGRPDGLLLRRNVAVSEEHRDAGNLFREHAS